MNSALLVLALATTTALGAEPSYSAAPAEVSFSYAKEAFEPWAFDTGWWPRPNPKGAPGVPPIQVRFTGAVGGGMRASAAGDIHLGWQPWQHWAVGNPDGGALSMDLGVEVATFLRLTITLPNGAPFQWEGEIPGIEGFDYRFAADGTFTPFLMAGGAGAANAVVSDAIQKTKLFSVPLTPTLIPIPELNGTLDVYAGGVLDLIVRDGRLVFPSGVLSRADAPLVLTPHSERTHRTTVGYEATAVYSSILELEPTVVLHLGPLDWNLAAFPIPVPLSPIEETWSFNAGEPTEVEFSLPRLELTDIEGGAVLATSGELDFGTGSAGEEVTRAVRLTNVGLATLTGALAVSGDGFSVDASEPFSLEPYAVVERVITVRRNGQTQSGTLAVESSDPSGPRSVALVSKPVGGETTDGGSDPLPGGDGGTGTTGGGNGADGGQDEGGHPFDEVPLGCACSGGPSAALPFGVLLLAMFLRRRGTRG